MKKINKSVMSSFARKLVAIATLFFLVSGTVANAMCSTCDSNSHNQTYIEVATQTVETDCQHKNKTVNGNTEVNENCTEAGCPSIAQLNKVELSLTQLHLTLKHDIEPNSKYGSLDPEKLKEPPKT